MNDKTLDLIQNNIDTISKQIPEAAKSAHEIAVMYVQWHSLLNIAHALIIILFCSLGVGIGAFIGSKEKYDKGTAIAIFAGLGLACGLVLGMMTYPIVESIFYYLNPNFGIIDMIINR